MVRLGIDLDNVGAIVVTRLRARRSVRRRGLSGKFVRVVMSLSVKSIASWSWVRTIAVHASVSLRALHGAQIYTLDLLKRRRSGRRKKLRRRRTLATPRFSIAGILCPELHICRFHQSCTS